VVVLLVSGLAAGAWWLMRARSSAAPTAPHVVGAPPAAAPAAPVPPPAPTVAPEAAAPPRQPERRTRAPVPRRETAPDERGFLKENPFR
jgi:hypothetical protein